MASIVPIDNGWVSIVLEAANDTSSVCYDHLAQIRNNPEGIFSLMCVFAIVQLVFGFFQFMHFFCRKRDIPCLPKDEEANNAETEEESFATRFVVGMGIGTMIVAAALIIPGLTTEAPITDEVTSYSYLLFKTGVMMNLVLSIVAGLFILWFVCTQAKNWRAGNFEIKNLSKCTLFMAIITVGSISIAFTVSSVHGWIYTWGGDCSAEIVQRINIYATQADH